MKLSLNKFLIPLAPSVFCFAKSTSLPEGGSRTSTSLLVYARPYNVPVNITLTAHPLFLWLKQAQRKSLAKRNADKGISPLRRREGVRRLHSRELLKKLDQNFYARQKCRLNTAIFEKNRPKLLKISLTEICQSQRHYL